MHLSSIILFFSNLFESRMSSPTHPKRAKLCVPESSFDLSPLEKLPTELAWMVIEYASETVSELRLVNLLLQISIYNHLFQTSQKLKFHVDNLALQTNSIPLVKLMRFTGYIRYRSTMRQHHNNLFMMDNRVLKEYACTYLRKGRSCSSCA